MPYTPYLEFLDEFRVSPGRDRRDLGIEGLGAHLETDLTTTKRS